MGYFWFHSSGIFFKFYYLYSPVIDDSSCVYRFFFALRFCIFIFLSPLAQILLGLGIYIILLEKEHFCHNVSDTESLRSEQWTAHQGVPAQVHTGPHVSESRSLMREDKLERCICPTRQGKGILLKPLV